ncbi:MAG TPA: hypothetical protein PKC39_14575 [Ferruginibacter sp.]|nr:hypothetical protein [Ferruginibacter sp.]HMP22181.1 hypothetical protein [Ferruginibacter sp.]
MSQQDQQPVDLNKLSERELLILTYKKVEELEGITGEQTKAQNATDIEMAIIKTKMQMWSGIIGFVAGLIASILMMGLQKLLQ